MDTTVRSLHLGYRFRTPVTDLSNTTRGRSHMLIDRIWPPYALSLQCADMELSPVRDADLPELPEIARLTRTVSTGSWLAPEEQGRGFGTRMRSMVIDAFARYFGTHR